MALVLLLQTLLSVILSSEDYFMKKKIGIIGGIIGCLLTANPVQAQLATSPTCTISTIAGTGQAGYSGDGGFATDALLNSPTSITVHPSGDLYITDAQNARIRRISGRRITTVAGIGVRGFTGDGQNSTFARLTYPTQITSDRYGNIYFYDSYRVRRISPQGVINTVAGNGYPGFAGNNGPAVNAEINDLYGLAADSRGNLYLADYYNNQIRKVAPDGIITSELTDLPNLAPTSIALLPMTLSTMPDYEIFFSNVGRVYQRAINYPSTTSRILAGIGTTGYAGDNGSPYSANLTVDDMVIDANRNIYIASGNRIRRVNFVANTTNQTITTVAGNGSTRFSGANGSLALAAGFQASKIAADASGNIYIADAANNMIRMLTCSGSVPTNPTPLTPINVGTVPSTQNLNPITAPNALNPNRGGNNTTLVPANNPNGANNPNNNGGSNNPLIPNAPIGGTTVINCGNGRIDAGEGCDDGNLSSGDGCTATCAVETPHDEPSICGNGVLENEEQCDDSNTESGDGCDSTCFFEAVVPTVPGAIPVDSNDAESVPARGNSGSGGCSLAPSAPSNLNAWISIMALLALWVPLRLKGKLDRA